MAHVSTTKKNRQTGTQIELWDNRDDSFDVDGGPWITYCVDHGSYCEHDTRTLAQSFMSCPDEWCGSCGGEI